MRNRNNIKSSTLYGCWYYRFLLKSHRLLFYQQQFIIHRTGNT